MLSFAVKEVIETVNEVLVSGTLKEVIVGGVVSEEVSVIVTGAPTLRETLPAASLAHA
jgi:hypothetical protein